jgi:hypothetical protein
MAFIVKREIIAPTSLPLSTPNLYFSALTFVPNASYRNTNFVNPYQRQSNTYWREQVQNLGSLSFNGSFWILYANSEIYDYENNEWTSYVGQVAYCAGDGSSIPLTGWVNGGGSFTVNGTLVISTTP